MNILAIAVQLYAEPRMLAVVPKEDFYPQPKVDSAILVLDLFKQPKFDIEEKKFSNY